MSLETTMNIKKELSKRIDEVAEELGISRSRMVSILIKKFMENNEAGKKAFEKLTYQERGGDYAKKSLYFNAGDYEMWCDLRKAYKLSASCIIALAIELYLDDILNGTEKPDNYCNFYTTKPKYYGHVYTNLIIWGSPDKRNLQKLLEV